MRVRDDLASALAGLQDSSATFSDAKQALRMLDLIALFVPALFEAPL